MTGEGAHVSALWFRVPVLLALFTANPLVRAEDTVTAERPLSGDGKLVSRGGKFALGFFQPGGGAAGRWYVGIWYHNISVRTPVWVANRDRPVYDPAASQLAIAGDGNLVLLDPSGGRAWSTNAIPNKANATVVAILLDTGNLVLASSRNASDVLWESFDHIGDTWLPGGKLRRDKVTGVTQGMTSWRARGDPAPGPYTLQLDPARVLRFVLLWNRTRDYYWATGDWNGRFFTGTPDFTGAPGFAASRWQTFRFVNNDRESYFTYGFEDKSMVYRFVVDVSGMVQGWLWVEESQGWILMYEQPGSQCAVPPPCGAFGVCSEGASTACVCATGFSPRDAARWSLGDYTDGCVRNAELQCRKNSSSAGRLEAIKQDRFFLMLRVRLPDDGRVSTGASSSCGDCEQACLGDCSCSAFAYNGSCILWHGDLKNLEDTYRSLGSTGSLYLRLAATEPPGSARSRKLRTIEIAVGAFAIICFVVTACGLIVCTTMSRRAAKVHGFSTAEGGVIAFEYRDLQFFTKNLSVKLGNGAFGSVFRGQLPDHTAIAVKKLEGLWQGDKQFRAEVSTLGTIHHVNLIRLLGFCSDSDRKLLVYEYMPNGSLDRHLFGATLSWRARYRIAVGVAKGLAYLHDKCRDCIIHCDVKPENILLDAKFAPKVADFGLAKLVGRDFSRVLTTMRGTIGYLAPEWIGSEAVTAKVDVFSFGMMLFEVVSGRRNVEHGKTGSSSGTDGEAVTANDAAEEATFFPVMAARRLVEADGDVMALLDPAVGGDAGAEEVRRVCKVACWCIQDEVHARPTMAEVVLMMEGVTDVDVPPVPRYLQVLAGRSPMHGTEDYSS